MDANKNTNTQQNPVTQPKKHYIRRQYIQGIICDLDTRESGKKRYFWTKIILVILIISIVLIIVSLTLLGNNNTNWWVYLIFGSLGVIGCAFGHYYNTKTYIENSKYDIDIDDIAAFIDIKNAIKKTINTISLNQKEIDNLNRQINIILGKNKAKALASSIASSTSKGFSSLADKSKSGFSSLRNKMKPTNTIVPATTQPLDATNSPSTTTTSPSMAAAANEFYVGGDDDLPVLEDPNKQSVQEDPQLKSLKNQLDLVKSNLKSNKTVLDKQMIEYNKLKEKNDDYKEIKMANQHNKNIIYNISDLYDAKSLLDNINYIQYENKDIEYETNLLNNLNDDEKNIFNEYKAIINDIEQIKSLNDKQNDISQKIINLTNINFEIEYLKNLKVNNLNKYIDEFFNDINDTLINKSDIDKYFTIIENKPIINSSLLPNYMDQSTIFNSKYDRIYNIIKDKYTNLAIEKINNIIGKDNEYSDEKVNKLIEQYNKYSNKDLGYAFTERYKEIMKQLVIDFGKYVYNILGYPGTLESLLAIPNIDNKITAIKNHIEGIMNPIYSSKLYEYTTLPIISQNPNYDSKPSLLQTIAEPFVNELNKAKDEKIKLANAKALAESSSNNSIFQGVTNVLGLNKK